MPSIQCDSRSTQPVKRKTQVKTNTFQCNSNMHIYKCELNALLKEVDLHIKVYYGNCGLNVRTIYIWYVFESHCIFQYFFSFI